MKKIEPYLEWKKILAPFQNHWCIIGCSGGIDSMVLLHFLHSHHFKMHVVHVNYHKRGEDSKQDEEFVKEYCNINSIPFSSFRFESTKNQSTNFQEAAREFRYAKFEEVAENYENSVVVLAHHADDQIETFFMNLVRNSGVVGLAGMLTVHNNIVRPMLHSSKIELSHYADIHQLTWREDSSNATNDYARNRWRNEFIPFLEEQIPEIKSSVLRLVEEFQTYQQTLSERANHFVEQIHSDKTLKISELEKLNEFERFEIWRQLHQLPQTFASFDKLATLQVGKHTEMISGFEKVVREKDYLYFENSLKQKHKFELKIQHSENLPNVFDKNKIYLDASKIEGDLVLRNWKDGDKIKSIGIDGNQLVSDIIKDAKIPHHQKNEILLVSDDTEIHWVVGLKIGKTALAERSCTSILELTVTKVNS